MSLEYRWEYFNSYETWSFRHLVNKRIGSVMEYGFFDGWLFNGEQVPSLLAYTGLFVLGLFAGILNVIAGGGSFLTLPLLIFLGLPPSMANGTNRVGIFLQNFFAVWSFRQHDVMHWRALGWAAFPAMIGAPLGTWLALSLPDATFQKLLAFLMVGITLWSLWIPKVGQPMPSTQWSVKQTVLVGLGFFLVGMYGGFVQAGVGFMILALTSFLGFDLVRGNGLKVLIVLVFTGVSLMLFAWYDKIHWPYGFVLAGGTVLGGLLGVRVTMLKGHEWLRHVVTILIVLFAIKLWFTA